MNKTEDKELTAIFTAEVTKELKSIWGFYKSIRN